MHIHEHHNDDHHHEHGHEHTHGHDNSPAPENNSHDNLLQSKEEAAAFLNYTLHHNAHHEEELGGLAHSLEHLQLQKEAQEIRLAIEDLGRANLRLEAILKVLS